MSSEKIVVQPASAVIIETAVGLDRLLALQVVGEFLRGIPHEVETRFKRCGGPRGSIDRWLCHIRLFCPRGSRGPGVSFEEPPFLINGADRTLIRLES